MTIAVMKRVPSKKKRPVFRASCVELAGALSIASQMALLCPPGFDEVVRRELAGDAESVRDLDGGSDPLRR